MIQKQAPAPLFPPRQRATVCKPVCVDIIEPYLSN